MPFPGWVERIGDFDVSKQEGQRPNGQPYLELVPSTQRVIWHTTEGSTVDGAVGRLREQFSAPHFVIGENRIVQMRPLWAQAATVRGDNSRAWQVETVGFSKTALWLHTAPTLQPMIALLGFFLDLGVPLERPTGWQDNGGDIKGVWATEGNSRRTSGRALDFVGHVTHLEWPENTHWDMGAFNWTRIFELVEADMEDPRFDKFVEGVRARRDGIPFSTAWPEYKKFGYKLLDDAIEKPGPGTHAHPEIVSQILDHKHRTGIGEPAA